MILTHINLDEYQIILFSDDIIEGTSFIKPLGISFITANSILTSTIDQFYMLMLCDIIVCANSTFSLMSCFMNEIFKFKENSKYFVPSQWFGELGPVYNIYDIVPNNEKFQVVFFNYKCAVIFFHKNIQNLYKENWVKTCVDSILQQKFVQFDVFEVNYGNSDYSIFKNLNKLKYFFYKRNYVTHTEAMTFLLNKCFLEHEYDYVFNTNMDDYYDTCRFYYQLQDIIINNNLLNSSLWYYISEINNKDVLYPKGHNKFIYDGNQLKWIQCKDWDNCSHISYNPIDYNIIIDNINKFSNPINHSGVCFTKKFWTFYNNDNRKLRYRMDKPYEDISLWYRSVQQNIKLGIINKHLILYRIHTNQIGEKNKKKDNLNSNEKKEFIDGPIIKKIVCGKIILINDIYELTEKIFQNADIFYICTTQDKYESVNEFLYNNHIRCLVKTYNSNKNYNNIINLFDIEIDSSCDQIVLEDKQQIVKIHDIIFYTVFYQIKSKFSTQIYINWSINFFESLKSYKVVLFTDKNSFKSINHITDKYQNIDIIFKELTEFQYYKYLDIFQKNTINDYFPNHDISAELLLLYVNRHLFCSEIKNAYTFQFLSYLDIGYFRNGVEKINNITFAKFNKYKISLVLVKSEQEYINKLTSIYKIFNKEDVQNYLTNISVAGGGFILHSMLIDKWVEKFDTTFQKFKDQNIDFKDDQNIIFKVIVDNYSIFNLLKNNDWFYLRHFLIN